ncbi:MAG: LPXTG cell wall anchor domain-containing protein, partial [Lactobacillus gallinarum]|uniref:LPXTG cell wall anchor domain-containing protein n=1 Tax=Lactobacillus gallinarum TaxID=52242 RepID=UPI003818356B
TYPDTTTDTIEGSKLVRPTEDKDNYDPHGPKNPDDRVPVKDPDHLTDGEKNDVKDEIGKENPDLPKGTEVDVDDKGNATIKYPDGSQDTIPGDQLVQGQKGDTTDAGNITPTIPGGKVTVKDPSHLTETEKGEVKNNVDNANKDKFPAGTEITVGKDGTATITYPDKSTDTIPGDKLVKGEDSGSTSGQTDAGNITPTIPGDKVTVKDPSHLTDDEKNQVKDNVDNANKGNFPAGTNITVGDDGTTTVTYPDGSKDTIPGRDLIIGVKAVNNQVVDANGNVLVGWQVVNGQPVKSSDQPVMTREAHKAQQAKTLPQTGEKDNKLGILGLLSVSLASLFGLGEKKKKED